MISRPERFADLLNDRATSSALSLSLLVIDNSPVVKRRSEFFVRSGSMEKGWLGETIFGRSFPTRGGRQD